jgi:antitoxin (DNA-binding transcriptional repressor) of toxin-antitoxin stability system
MIGSMKVNVADAKNKLPELIKAVESGASVTICRRGRPVVDLVRTIARGKGKRKLGILKGQGIEIDPDWWKPMTEEEADDFIEGHD